MVEMFWCFILIPLAPLAGVMINGLFGWKFRRASHLLACSAVGISFICSAGVFVWILKHEPVDVKVFDWIYT
jgi:NADH-quinone oxidoreductase subunit L